MSSFHVAARALAHAFLAGPWQLRSMLARGDFALDAGGLWLRAIASDVLSAFPEPPLHSPSALEAFVRSHPALRGVWRRELRPGPVHFLPFEPRMGRTRWPIPHLVSRVELARWLGLRDAELDWFADRRSLNRTAPTELLRHYDAIWVPRGARLPRLLESPKPRLKALQRRLLSGILDGVPPHPAAHGFVRGRSVASHAAVHAGQPVVMRFDLAHFFSSIAAPRALGAFKAMGFPEDVATTLVGLCTTRTPERLLQRAPQPEPFTPEKSAERFWLQRHLSTWHLPQGAPTSPALSNLVAFALDVRLAGYADERGLRYSRYADDLVFSGDIASPGPLHDFVRRVAIDEGFRLNEAKTRLARAHRRQKVTGVVVNVHPNLARHEFDRLKATLHRCVVRGPAQVDADIDGLRARLHGKVAWAAMLSPARGARLAALLSRIDWSAPSRAVAGTPITPAQP